MDNCASARKLAAADPANTEWQRDVSVSLNKLGNLKLRAGDAAGALAAYEEDLAIARKLAAADPDSIEGQSDLVVSLWKISEASSDRSRKKSSLQEALGIVNRLENDGPLAADQQKWRAQIEGALAGLAKGASSAVSQARTKATAPAGVAPRTDNR